ncbi:MAG: tRNA (adenosine(37)-N6)-threonylcarbamoyltransferase complex ATPase subunit type 1 TsaE [Polyangiales bacterium]
MRVELATRRATIRLAQALGAALAPGDLVILEGGLGAGKTFLVRAMLRALGVAEEIAVPSPTFTLMNEYPARIPVIHADLYRLLGSEDLELEVAELGLRSRRGEGAALVVEWGTEAFETHGGDGLRISIERTVQEAGDTRVATITGDGPRGKALLASLAATLSPAAR